MKRDTFDLILDVVSLKTLNDSGTLSGFATAIERNKKQKTINSKNNKKLKRLFVVNFDMIFISFHFRSSALVLNSLALL